MMANSPKNKQILQTILSGLNRLRHRLLMVEVKLLPNHPVTHKRIISFAGLFFLAGMLLFLTVKLLPSEPLFQGAYYTWDKSVHCVLWFCIAMLYEPLRRFLLIIFTYNLIRLLWQIIVDLTGEDINHPRWITITWLTLVTYFVYLSVKELINEWKSPN